MTTTSDNKILSELRHDGQLLHLTLNAPKANVVDAQMMTQIEAALAEHGKSPNLKLIVFEGAGKHFSFGASVEEHTAERAPAMLEQFHGMFHKLAKLEVPTAAIVRGQCLGGGMELASFCTWLFASPSARFGQPEIKLAVFPPMASILLPWRCGGGAALDLCVSGRTVDAQEAQRIGLVSAVHEDPAAACNTFFSEELAPLSASSLRFAERATRMSLVQAMDRDLPQLEKMYVEELMKSHDANEGITAFLEKRKPAYRGLV